MPGRWGGPTPATTASTAWPCAARSCAGRSRAATPASAWCATRTRRPSSPRPRPSSRRCCRCSADPAPYPDDLPHGRAAEADPARERGQLELEASARPLLRESLDEGVEAPALLVDLDDVAGRESLGRAAPARSGRLVGEIEEACLSLRHH